LTKTLLPFTIAALGIGVPLLALSTIIKPDAPFVLAAVLLGLALPALFLTHRESGGAAVRAALLRDCVRLPTSWWWLPLAAFAVPVATWTTGSALGGAKPLGPHCRNHRDRRRCRGVGEAAGHISPLTRSAT
jgi:hypothetical protein